ncbi:PREDICTED: uncharacterized protein LOC104592404 isoform X2 [Nelumbo nucifera]|uniref:Uncharacterized protein LOC104592404 isoform X2 n=1 Tax=Nelumbo nucifera TaxID=4432 RepID=A0A1U7ZN99_NELNU|nr:PREDICTED: uncharacterized protein LOC104592404 isoform X2 [Nelumbo nucifera]
MGVLAPISHWIPEDDLLLKNAVEAGASLESLAKGAVRFSRRFTIRELQDRWYSLLYDADIAAEASARMVEFELSVENLSSKSNRSGNIKGNQCAPGKRKTESIRSHYYAMRKRICNEPCNSVDTNFLVAPNVHAGNGGGCQEQLTLPSEPPFGNCMLGNPISNHLGLQETDFDIVCHAFPQIVGDSTDVAGYVEGTAHVFHSGNADAFDNHPDLYGGAVRNGKGHSFEHDDVHRDIPHILGENPSVFGNCTGPQEVGPSQEPPVNNLFETENIEGKPSSTFGSVNTNPRSVCSGFGHSQGFSSPVPDCGAAFQQLGCSSPLARMPIWETIQDAPTSAVPIDVSLGDKDQVTGDTLTCPDNAGAAKVSTLGYEVKSEPKLEEIACADVLPTKTTILDGDFMDLSDSLLNFGNDEELLFIDADGKDIMDTSCLDGLDSILLSSPSDIHQGHMPSITEPKASVLPDTCLSTAEGGCPGESSDIGYALHPGSVSGHKLCEFESTMPTSTPVENIDSLELHNGVICCRLNMEDPEIPCNDDIFIPNQMESLSASSEMQHEYKGSKNPSSAKDLSDNRKASEQGLRFIKEEEGEIPARPLQAPRMELEVLPDRGPGHPVSCCGVKSELHESGSLGMAFRHVGTVCGDPSQCRPLPDSVQARSLKEVITKAEIGKHHDFNSLVDPFLEKQVHASDHTKSCPRNIVRGCKVEEDVPIAIAAQKNLSSNAEPCSVEMASSKPDINPLTSDQEEQLSESDGDVPYFSDVEAMILDMDLGPDDQDSYFSREVSRYQCEDAKRAIIRLELGFQSYMERDIISHGAFAVLYGRHLKHYIRKPEVLLGRATDDINVDIDLGREGRANKISRRQIRGMRLMFETSQSSMRQYLTNISRKKCQDKNTKFQWSPEAEEVL